MIILRLHAVDLISFLQLETFCDAYSHFQQHTFLQGNQQAREYFLQVIQAAENISQNTSDQDTSLTLLGFRRNDKTWSDLGFAHLVTHQLNPSS